MECWNGEILSCEKGVCVIECHHTLTKTNQINCACVRHLEVVISIAREYFRDQLIISWFFVHKYLLHIGLDETNQVVCLYFASGRLAVVTFARSRTNMDNANV